jgi:hypothetical protein
MPNAEERIHHGGTERHGEERGEKKFSAGDVASAENFPGLFFSVPHSVSVVNLFSSVPKIVGPPGRDVMTAGRRGGVRAKLE